jgi:hypothetical protein
MKRKNDLKKESLTMIDPALLEEILGSVQTGGSDGKSGAVIPQASFHSHFHS